MKVEMISLNKVKYATSEEQKQKLMNEGYQPVVPKKGNTSKEAEKKDA